MCGIGGVVYSHPEQPVERDLLARMVDSIRYRGPDRGGFHVAPGIGLGIQRLSIIDLQTGDQPLFNEDRTVAVVCNGEIYNFPELRHKLVAKEHYFRTQSDCEVIVHLYEEFGTECVHRLRGMFGFALWDCRTPAQAAAYLKTELRSGDLVLVKGRATEHLSRIVFAQFGQIGCWTTFCRKRISCDTCDQLRPEFDLRALSPLGADLQTAPTSTAKRPTVKNAGAETYAQRD